MKKVKFRNEEVFIVDSYVPNNKRVAGFKYYFMRHSDDDMTQPLTIEDYVIVNRWGTLACRKPLNFAE